MTEKLSLRVGDLISLSLSKPGEGWLSCDGKLGEECFVQTNLEHFEECIWEVNIQYQYSAAIEYEEAVMALMANEQLSNLSLLPEEKKVLAQLERAATNEKRLNQKMMKMKRGKAVHFGDHIQLRHVKSGKFITVSGNKLAKQERENMRVTIESNGNSLSCLGFLPKYKYDREGQEISNFSEAFIRVHERQGEFLHSAKRTKGRDRLDRGEINCSLEQTCWTISIFQPYTPHSTLFVSACQLLSIQDPDTSAYLTIEEHGTGTSKVNRVVMAPQIQLSSRASYDTYVGTNLLWQVEKETITEGGFIQLRKDRVLLRDLNSGLYMKVDPESGDVTAVKFRADATILELHNSQLTNLEYLQEESSFQISYEGLWLSQMSLLAGNSKSISNGRFTTMTSERSNGLVLVVNSILQRNIGSDLYIAVKANNMMKRFLVLTKNLSKNVKLPELILSFQTHFKLIMSVLEQLTVLLTNRSRLPNDELATSHISRMIGLTEEEFFEFFDYVPRETISYRQVLFREQGILDTLMELLELGVKVNSLKSLKTNRPTRTHSIDFSQLKQQPEMLLNEDLLSNKNFIDNDEDEDDDSSESDSDQFRSDSLKPISPLTTNPDTRRSLTKEIARRTSLLFGGSGSSSSINISSSDTHDSHHPQKKQTPSPISNPDIPPSRAPFIKALKPSPKSSNQNRAFNTQLMKLSQNKTEKNSGQGKTTQNHTQKVEIDVIDSCLRVLFSLLKENHQNQMHVADKFPVLLKQVKQHQLAVACVQEMLKDNLQILQNKVKQREIDMFVELLVETKMSVTFLRLLQSTCSCPMGVDSTQRMVTFALFGSEIPTLESSHLKTPTQLSTSLKHSQPILPVHIPPSKSLMIQFLPNPDRRHEFKWENLHIYAPISSTGTVEEPYISNILGYNLIADGLPEIYVKWLTEGELSMMELFGVPDKVSLIDVCMHHLTQFIDHHPHHSKHKQQPSHVSSAGNASPQRGPRMSLVGGGGTKRAPRVSMIRKKHHLSHMEAVDLRSQVADYLEAELYLVADLCLDRNYVAISILEKKFQYEVMLSMLINDTLPNKFKAPVCKILRCLYIDREPQIIVRYPRLIRTSNSLIRDDSIPDFRKDDKGYLYTFSLLQHAISDYIHSHLDCTKCDSLSAEMMDLLQCLVSFGFYITDDQMKHVVKPLIRALDRHRYSEFITSTREDLEDSTETQSWFSIFLSNISFLNPSAKINPSNDLVFAKDFEMVKKGSRVHRKSQLIDLSSFPVKTEPTFSDSFQGNSKGITTTTPVPALDAPVIRDQKNINNNNNPTNPNEKLEPKQMWEKKYLNFTESIYGMIFILTIVIVTVAIATIEQFRVIHDKDLRNQLATFDTFVSAFFASEIALRFFAFLRVYRTFFSFFSNLFNSLDFSLVLLDLSLLGVGAKSGYVNAGRVTRTFRVIRLLRLLRVIRAIRLMKQLAEASQNDSTWISPPRYAVVAEQESKTIVNILKTLSMIFDHVQDKHLGYIVTAFIEWNEQNEPEFTPLQIYSKVLLEDKRDSISNMYEGIEVLLIDMLMYSDKKLVHESLRLLMVYLSRNERLLSFANQMQIISSPKIEKIYSMTTSMLRELKKHADMFEIWSEFQTPEHIQTSNNVQYILEKFIEILIRPNLDGTLGIRSEYLVDEEVQSLLRNLDALAVLVSLLHSLFAGSGDVIKPQVLKMLQTCNKLICWFVKNSELNQIAAFKHIDWFIERVDDGIGSSKVVKEILLGNRELIKQCSRRYIGDFANKILKFGKKPEYLDLYVGMIKNVDLMDCRVPAVESEISRYLTSREWSHHILMWCVTFDTPAYSQRQMAMERFLHVSSVLKDEDLSPELEYHINLLTLLAGCNLGPKLQAIYPADDVIYAILDLNTIFPVRKALGLVLIEILKSGDDICFSEYLWKLFDQITLSMENDFMDLKKHFKRSNTIALRIEKGEWLAIVLNIITVFFSQFDLARFSQQDCEDGNIKVTTRSEFEIISLMKRLYGSMRNYLDHMIQFLDATLKDSFGYALFYLSHHSDAMILDPKILDYLESKETKSSSSSSSSSQRSKNLMNHRNSVTFSEVHQKIYRDKYLSFLESLDLLSIPEELKHLQRKGRGGGGGGLSHFLYEDKIQHYLTTAVHKSKVDGAVLLFEKIPSLTNEHTSSDVRIEPLVKKLTKHIRNCIKKAKAIRTLDSSAEDTTHWLLTVFRQLIEKQLTISIAQATPLSIPIIQNDSLEKYRNIFNEYGLVHLCLDLISIGINQNISGEAVKLLITLLLKEGGNPKVHQTIFRILKDTDSVLFFDYIKETIDNLILSVQRIIDYRTNDSSSDGQYMEEFQFHPCLFALTLLQLLCEGESSQLQNILRDQTGNSRNVDYLELLAQLLDLLSRQKNVPYFTYISVRILKTIQKLLSGPCKGNQEAFVLQTELLVTLNRLMRLSGQSKSKSTSRSVYHESDEFDHPETIETEKEYFNYYGVGIDHEEYLLGGWRHETYFLQEKVLDVLAACIEGQLRSSVVFERVATTIEFSVFSLMLLPSGQFENNLLELESNELGFKISPLVAKYLVLLRTFNEKALTTITKEMIDKDIVSVQVLWKGKVHSIFFPIPDITKHLSQDAKKKIIDEIECVSQEQKLKDFTKRVKILHSSALHQEKLKEFGVTNLHQIKVNLNWIMFVNALIMNMVLLGFLKLSPSHYSSNILHHDDHVSSHDDSIYHHQSNHSNATHHSNYTHYNSTHSNSTHYNSTIHSNSTNHSIISSHVHAALYSNPRPAVSPSPSLHSLQFVVLPEESKHDSTIQERNYYPYNSNSSHFEEENSGMDARHLSASGAVHTVSQYHGWIPDIDKLPNNVVKWANIIQIAFAGLMILIMLVGMMPVKYASHKENGQTHLEAMMSTFMDPMFLWYLFYFVIALFGTIHRLFLSVLLLDWVLLDATTRDVLLAIQYPAQQLVATFIIIIIIVNIFSGISFVHFRHDVVGFRVFDMWESFKLSFGYGIRGEYGMAYQMTQTIGNRLVLDIAFYFIVLAILREIFFAIIVESFAKLRELKFERDAQANNRCFICGLERHDFDKLSTNSSVGLTHGFAYHRTYVHNITNYLYFIMHIWSQRKEEDNGLEMFVRQCISIGDISWFPIGIHEEGDAGASPQQQLQKHEKSSHSSGHGSHFQNENHGATPKSRSSSISSDTATPSKIGETAQKMQMMRDLKSIQKQLSIIASSDDFSRKSKPNHISENDHPSASSSSNKNRLGSVDESDSNLETEDEEGEDDFGEESSQTDSLASQPTLQFRRSKLGSKIILQKKVPESNQPETSPLDELLKSHLATEPLVTPTPTFTPSSRPITPLTFPQTSTYSLLSTTPSEFQSSSSSSSSSTKTKERLTSHISNLHSTTSDINSKLSFLMDRIKKLEEGSKNI